MDTTKTITHVSLCAGYDGLGMGLKNAIRGVRTGAYVEIEAFACQNLVAKMEEGLLDAAPIWTDLKTFPYAHFRGKVDVLSGGFPCQPFSQAGNRAGDSDERHLFPYILAIIKTMRPAIVFLENVEGILSAKLNWDGWRDPAGTPVLLHVLRELERVGYTVTAGMFSAEEVGAPHRRNRIFILGMDNSQSAGLEGFFQSGEREGGWACESGSASEAGVQRTRWPARPGHEQYEWEPPRVLANTKHAERRAEG